MGVGIRWKIDGQMVRRTPSSKLNRRSFNSNIESDYEVTDDENEEEDENDVSFSDDNGDLF